VGHTWFQPLLRRGTRDYFSRRLVARKSGTFFYFEPGDLADLLQQGTLEKNEERDAGQNAEHEKCDCLVRLHKKFLQENMTVLGHANKKCVTRIRSTSVTRVICREAFAAGAVAAIGWRRGQSPRWPNAGEGATLFLLTRMRLLIGPPLKKVAK